MKKEKRILLTVLIGVFFLVSCGKKEGCTNPFALNYDVGAEEEDCSCVAYVDDMEGTFNVVVTSYPREKAQEGNAKNVLVFNDHFGCNSSKDSDFNKIKFNNLFTFFGCDKFVLTEKYYFEITLDHNAEWSGASVTGIGSIIDDIFHFEGIVYTSAGEFPIILDGTKISDDRRTSTC